MPEPTTLATLETQTIQDLPDAQKDGAGLSLFGYLQRGPLLPAWGTRLRERALRNLYRQDYNWMVQGAFAGIMSIVASTAWEITGPDELTQDESKFWRSRYKAVNNGRETTAPRPDIEYYQELLRQADFGRGWSAFCKKGVDYLRQDAGWFWELIAPGDPLKPPTGPVTGIAHLDSIRCIPTGDPEFPVIYYSRYNKFHLLHTSRVVQLMDMPDGDDLRPGYGLCALSRAAAISWREILLTRYIETRVDDKPPPGIVVAKGMLKDERERALNAYRNEQAQDETPPWGRQLWFYAADPSIDVGLDVQAFSQAPENFDFRDYTEVDIDALALAIGVDRQDLWQLTGGNIGSKGQSETLQQKSRGKLLGSLRADIERQINDLLPDEYEFAFKYRDAQADQESAAVATAWAGVATSLKDSGLAYSNEGRALLADVSEEIKDAFTDKSGSIREVSDADVQPPEMGIVPAPAPTVEPNAQPGLAGQQHTDDTKSIDSTVRERPGLDADLGGFVHADHHQKAIDDTASAFKAAFSDLIGSRIKGDVSGMRFGIIGRDLLRKTILQAVRDGLEAGGVPQTDELGAPLPLDEDDQSAYEQLVAQQSVYLSDFGRTLSKGMNMDTGARAEMWVNKAVLAGFDVGRLSADANGMYEFVGEDGQESCKTCKRLKFQVHRLKDWERRKLRPKVDTTNFVCKGYRCQHRLIKTTERARGRF